MTANNPYPPEHEEDLKQDLCRMCFKKPRMAESSFCYECANNGRTKYYDPIKNTYYEGVTSRETFNILLVFLGIIMLLALSVNMFGFIGTFAIGFGTALIFGVYQSFKNQVWNNKNK